MYLLAVDMGLVPVSVYSKVVNSYIPTSFYPLVYMVSSSSDGFLQPYVA